MGAMAWAWGKTLTVPLTCSSGHKEKWATNPNSALASLPSMLLPSVHSQGEPVEDPASQAFSSRFCLDGGM